MLRENSATVGGVTMNWMKLLAYITGSVDPDEFFDPTGTVVWAYVGVAASIKRRTSSIFIESFIGDPFVRHRLAYLYIRYGIVRG